MGMTIDEAIEICEYIASEYPHCRYSEAMSLAIDAMRKYQKITEIVEAWKADVDIDSSDSMGDIREVIEDGNDSKRADNKVT